MPTVKPNKPISLNVIIQLIFLFTFFPKISIRQLTLFVNNRHSSVLIETKTELIVFLSVFQITLEEQQHSVFTGTPQTIFNEQNPKQSIDRETGEVVEMPLSVTPKYHKPTNSSSTNPATPSKSPSADSDVRKMFFEKLLLSSDTSVISGTMDSLRKTQSMDNLDANDDTELAEESRPRSASPNLEKMQTSPDSSVIESAEEKQEDNKKVEVESDKASSEHDDNKNISENQNNESLQEDVKVNGENKKPVLAKRLSTDSKRTHYSKENINLNIDTSTTTASADDRTDDIPPESPASSTKCRPFLDIPEFSWSTPHQRLLTELLFSVEKDIQVWKT